MSSLDSRNFVATATDIAAIAKAYSNALDSSHATRGTYLRALVATTQHALGAKPRLRASSDDKPTLDKEGIRTQMGALDSVHESFYEVVLANVEGNAEERNRKSGFARSAVSTVRAYIRSGFDITALAAARVTKAALASVSVSIRKPRQVSVSVLRKRADNALSTLSKIGDAVAKADKAAAIEVLEAIVQKLSGRLDSLGKLQPTTDAKRAVREGRPVKTKVGTFHQVRATAH